MKKEDAIIKIKELLSKDRTKKVICIGLLLVIALLSMTLFSKIATNPDNYSATIESIDNKKETVMGITATAATTSTILSAIPGDVTTPIANQILELSSYLLIVVCALVLEKSLLTVMGYLSFNILIPLACILLGVHIFVGKKTLKTLAFKFIVFALVIVLIIPLSMKISDIIYESNQNTVEIVSTEIENDMLGIDETDETSWINKTISKIKNEISDVGDKAREVLNKFIDAIALFIITYCVLPIIIVLVVVWFINFLFKVNIPVNVSDIKQKIVKSIDLKHEKDSAKNE